MFQKDWKKSCFGAILDLQVGPGRGKPLLPLCIKFVTEPCLLPLELHIALLLRRRRWKTPMHNSNGKTHSSASKMVRGGPQINF